MSVRSRAESFFSHPRPEISRGRKVAAGSLAGVLAVLGAIEGYKAIPTTEDREDMEQVVPGVTPEDVLTDIEARKQSAQEQSGDRIEREDRRAEQEMRELEQKLKAGDPDSIGETVE